MKAIYTAIFRKCLIFMPGAKIPCVRTEVFCGRALPYITIIRFLMFSVRVINFISMTTGACRDITSQEFAANDIKILVSGGKPWEFYNYNKVISSIGLIPELYTIMNFSVPETAVYALFDEYKEQTYYAEYAPDIL